MKFSIPVVLSISLAAAACGGSADKGETVLTNSNSLTTNNTGPVQGHPSDSLLPRTLFFGNPDKASPRISPNGSSLAYLADRDGVLNIWVGDIDNLDAAKPLTASDKRPIRGFFWAPDNKHILYAQDAGGNENWHVYSTDIQSGKTLDLTPMENIAAKIVGVSDKYPDKIVIGINNRNPSLHDLYTINIDSGNKKLLQENPGFVSMQVDDDYRVRFGTTMNLDGSTTIMQPAPSGKKASANPFPGWKPFLAIPQEDSLSTGIVGFDKSGKNIYLWDSRDRDTSALTLMNVKSGKSQLLAEHPKADGAGILFHPTSKKPLSVSFNYARREWKILDHSIAKDFENIKKVNGGEANVIASTKDNQTWILAFVTDTGPTLYYRWDRKSQKETYLFSNRKALEGLALSRMHARVVDARDGLKLVNYLSLPVESDPDEDGIPTQTLPTVLLVHGGPWARDSWGYNSLHQLLTNRGYAVLSVNFRGSTGFGKKFLNAANGQWSGTMHDDLIDSVNWAVSQGISQQDKVCIMGGSYGGYATLVGLTFTPDTFACGVDIVGPSRIASLLEAIPAYWKPMIDMFKTRVGDWTTPEGRAKLDAQSPLGKVGEIVKPLLIGQGANDPRVKQAEADQIAKAMVAKGIPVSYLLFPDEGHGFARPANNLAFFAATEAFLSAHLGGKYQPATAEEVSGTTLQVREGLEGIPGFDTLTKALNSQP